MTDRLHQHRLTLQSTPTVTSEASNWLRELGEQRGLNEELLFQLDLCANELLTNIGDYAYNGAAGEICLELRLGQNSATLTLSDSGPPFDPLVQPAPTLPTSLETAPCGGLGIYLVRQFVDDIRYERIDGLNRLTIYLNGGSSTPRKQERRIKQEVAFPLTRGNGIRINQDQRSGMDRRTLGFISRTVIFRDVPYHQVESILTLCKLRPCSAGEELLRKGKNHRCVYILIEGLLEVRLDGPDSRVYIEVSPGECVGELSVADGKPSSAWVVAATSGRLLEIPETVFLGPLLGIPSVARNLIVVLSERMRRSNLQIIERLRAELELESLQRELDVARQIQSSMLPTAPLFPGQTGIEGRGFMRAARQVGGDFYDAFPLVDGRLFVAIGDVCNKGTPAALFMVRTLTLLRSEALRPDEDAERHLARLAARSNDILCESNEAQQFVTLFCAIVDLLQNRLYFVNMGHNPPLFCLPNAAPEFVETPRNPLVGLVPGLKYTVGSRDFPVGSLLLIYTDGVTEAETGNGELFGDEALQQLLSDDAKVNADTCVERIITAVDAFVADHPQSDDITLLAIRRSA